MIEGLFIVAALAIVGVYVVRHLLFLVLWPISRLLLLIPAVRDGYEGRTPVTLGPGYRPSQPAPRTPPTYPVLGDPTPRPNVEPEPAPAPPRRGDPLQPGARSLDL